MKQHYTKDELRELGARGTAKPERLPAACVRCGAIIHEGDPVAWPTTGPDAGQYQCASSRCANPSDKNTDREKKRTPTPTPTHDAILEADITENIAKMSAEVARLEAIRDAKTDQTIPDPIFTPEDPDSDFSTDRDFTGERIPVIASYLRREPYDGKIEKLLDEGERNFLLVGGTGSGKTELAKALSAGLLKHKVKLERENLIVSMTIDNPLKEYLVRLDIKDGDTVRLPGYMVEMIQRPTVVCLDEANMIPPKGLAKLHEFLNEGKVYLPELGKTVYRHADNVVILTMNPSNKTCYRGTEDLSVALVERAQHVKVPDFKRTEIETILNCTDQDSKFLTQLRTAIEAGETAFDAVIGIRLMKQFVRNKRVFALTESLEMLTDTLNFEDPRIGNIAEIASLDAYPELTGNQKDEEVNN